MNRGHRSVMEGQTSLNNPIEKLAPGYVLAGRYEIGCILGSGGSGDIYKAHDRQVGRTVAIKLQQNNVDTVSAKRFTREAQILGHLSHPNVARIFSIANHEN